ncbi:hypothetical protein [Mycobacterium sp. 236(2023)]|uniref:hypothetical protein n=1 Tax=Mycobacterium sp. 236(2023) TaxID=3038163 RepID=UPI0024151066|nr:hypothetical protein [Mycobacterium sp. 236(2023)]MDG4663556.1 hypothetical protein [Mycobacterium sp. 236(2023)]
MRKEAGAVAIGAVLVAVAFVVPHLHLETVTPLLNADAARFRDFAATSPIFGWWNAHVGPGTVPAVLIAVAAVLWGPTLARRLPWRWLPWTAWAVSCTWAFSLAMIDGWQRGFAGRLVAKHEYLREVPSVTDIPEMLRTFASRILDFQPDSWITHVSGHPPGALLTFVWLDRIGLSGGAWAGLLCLLAGSSIAAAIVVTVRALADEDAARRAAVFAAVAPTAIWIAVSADGYFAGVAAWGITLLALAVTGRTRLPLVAAAGAGLLLGWGIFCNYGMGLMALPAVTVLLGASSWRAALRAFVPAAVAALAVAAVFYAAGFWWLDGYHLVQERYWQGIALERPFEYWGWANFAATVCSIGLGSVAALGRAFDVAAIKRRSGLHLLVFGALLSIVCADLSRLSKAETERIWLPFTVWLVAATALLPWRSLRWWLALNVIGALTINHVILTNW